MIIVDIFDCFDLCALISIADCILSSWRVFIHLVCSKIYNDKLFFLCQKSIYKSISQCGNLVYVKKAPYIYICVDWLNCIDNLICLFFFISTIFGYSRILCPNVDIAFILYTCFSSSLIIVHCPDIVYVSTKLDFIHISKYVCWLFFYFL